MKIIINNVSFDYNTGVRLLKTKNPDKPFKGLEDIWNDVIPMTFVEICTELKNIEQRRVAMFCLGTERLIKEVNPTLLKSETLSKTTTWINSKGELETIKFNDTYELYKIDKSSWSVGITNGQWSATNAYYVKFKDTSTDREYMIWVDAAGVYETNTNGYYRSNEIENITPIQSIAWTIQTNVPLDGIEKIVRQGDCILIKKKPKTKLLDSPRHLTEKEYRSLLVLES